MKIDIRTTRNKNALAIELDNYHKQKDAVSVAVIKWRLKNWA